ncbi:MAG: class I SAM-dependent methyltransferase [bacterium]
MGNKQCRFCAQPLRYSFVDLGMSPLSNAYLKEENLQDMERFYPLHAYVCESCFLVQLEEFESPENIFREYAYLSSYSDTWLKHAQNYTELMIQRFGLNPPQLVVELASNDGYLLQYFREKGFTVLGVEPAVNAARVAEEKGIPTVTGFFGAKAARELTEEGKQADLLVGNNVLAHVPDLNDFVEGMNIILKPAGVITLEFPHLVQLMAGRQFDTIYHEHFSYFSFTTVEKVFDAHGLTLFDVEELPTHGGSLRIYARHKEDTSRSLTERVAGLKRREEAFGIADLNTYQNFAERVKETKRKILDFFISVKGEGKRIAGYGAPAKGNTLLNYCGIGTDFLDYTVDRSPHKQGHFLPGTHIPVEHPDKVRETKPDYLVILPWNLKDEIMTQMNSIRDWGGKFVVLIPEVEVIS